jgi:hypothetical protein
MNDPSSFKRCLISSFIFIIIYSLYRKDSFWLFQIGLYCTLVRSHPPSFPLDSFPIPLKFHISVQISSTILPHLNLLHSSSSSHKYSLHTHCTCFTVLTFIIIYANVPKGFTICPHCFYFTLICSTPFIALLYPLPPNPHFLTAFNTYPYILYLHRCYVL